MSSKQLDISGLKSFKSKGLNVPKEWIDEAVKEVREYDRKDEVIINSEVSDYEERIKKLEAKLARAEGRKKKSLYSKNEEKILSAIKSEVINQKTDEPIMSRSLLIKKYGLNSKYIDKSIKGLELKKAVSRSEVSYSSKIKTFSWKILS